MSAAVRCKLLLYADDSALLVSVKDVVEIEVALSVEFEVVQEWLVDSKLSLHLGKTESILFSSKRRVQRKNGLMVNSVVEMILSQGRQ